MKKQHKKPEWGVVRLRPQGLVCTSPYDIIGPDEPNKPAGGHDFDFDDDIIIIDDETTIGNSF